MFFSFHFSSQDGFVDAHPFGLDDELQQQQARGSRPPPEPPPSETRLAPPASLVDGEVTVPLAARGHGAKWILLVCLQRRE